MSDDKTGAAGGRCSIEGNGDAATREWAVSLGVTEDELRKAVAAVGTSEAAVRQHLARPADVRLSTSGAVLGRLDLEYGAYGMVKERSGGDVPLLDERTVRGLGPNPRSIDKR